MCASLLFYTFDMKYIICFLFFITVAIDSSAQTIRQRYSSRLTQDGICYFFRKVELSKLENIDKFVYDMTYLDWNDSVAINFTIHSSIPNAPKVTNIKSGENSFICDKTERYFVDVTNNGYIIRSSAKYHKNDLDKIVFSKDKPIFCFQLGNTEASATYSDSAWKKDSKKLQSILNLIYSLKQ